MKSFNGVELEVGQKVIVLQVPVIGEHRFIHAEVKSISSKTVLVEGFFHDRLIRGLTKKEVRRYGHQIIVLGD